MSRARAPRSTYRLQLTPEFTFHDAAATVPYLADLGVSHVYLSPVLQAAPGSAHGYDVMDHQQLSAELGGPAAFAALVSACRAHDMGIVVDIVPNHMHVGDPEHLNAAWSDVLRNGRESRFASWFDIDWDAPGCEGKVLVPVLGDAPKVLVDRGELVVDGDVLRYHDHTFSLAAGTEGLELPALLERQHYRLAHWRQGHEQLNYRRFFDITTLAALRVEDDAVFHATHRTVVRLVRDGVVDGLRVDHPDGLADPGGYLDRLADATAGTWVVVEKILEGDETLPADWACAGTTGYDALNAVLGVLVDPAGADRLTALYTELTGAEGDWEAVAVAAKRDAVSNVLRPEIGRLSRVAATALDAPVDAVADAVRALLVAFPVYRVYARAGQPAPPDARATVARAVAAAQEATAQEAASDPDLVERLGALVLDGPPELVTRFAQTTGPAMAKGVEDTAFYRYARFIALNEVGGDPGRFGRTPADFHAFAARLARDWPATMVALSTHDTKRSEDVRARLAVLSELPDAWADAVTEWTAAANSYRSDAGPDPVTRYVVWQTLAGAWPLSVDRALAYAEKATREAKTHTAWVDGDPAYDAAVRSFVEQVLADTALCGRIAAFVDRIEPPARSNRLSQKLVALTMPGVPDTYQGTETTDLSLVDPDNRRPVDYAALRASLAAGDDDKQQVVRAALHLRRTHPEQFVGAAYTPLTATGGAAEHLLGFVRGDAVITLATRLPVRLAATNGWGDTAITLPAGEWTDHLTDRTWPGGRAHAVGALLDGSPVALLGTTSASPPREE